MHRGAIAPHSRTASTTHTYTLYAQNAPSLTIQRSSPRHRVLPDNPQRMLVPLEIHEQSPEMHLTMLPPTNERLPPAQGLPPACRLSAGKLHWQKLKAANVSTTSSGCLFVMDHVSKRHYLVDIGSDVCVFPRKLLPG